MSDISSIYAHWKFGMLNSEVYCRHIAYSQEDQWLNNGKVLRKVDKEVCPCAVRVNMNVTTKTLHLSFWTETFVWEDQAKGTRKTKRTRDSLESDVVSPRLKTLLSSPTKVFVQKTGSSSQQLNLKTLKSDSVQCQPLTTKIVNPQVQHPTIQAGKLGSIAHYRKQSSYWSLSLCRPKLTRTMINPATEIWVS